MKLSSKGTAVAEALTALYGNPAAEKILDHAGQIATFENDSMVRGPHILEAAASWARRETPSHESV
jgi:hypothetical protein